MFDNYLLDRMPPQIGDFVSDKVYEGLLKSNPSHPVKNDVIACYFVDVMGAKEQNDGDSFKVCFYGHKFHLY